MDRTGDSTRRWQFSLLALLLVAPLTSLPVWWFAPYEETVSYHWLVPGIFAKFTVRRTLSGRKALSGQATLYYDNGQKSAEGWYYGEVGNVDPFFQPDRGTSFWTPAGERIPRDEWFEYMTFLDARSDHPVSSGGVGP